MGIFPFNCREQKRADSIEEISPLQLWLPELDDNGHWEEKLEV